MLVLTSAATIAVCTLTARLRAHVRDVLQARIAPQVVLVDLPPMLNRLAAADLEQSIEPLPRDWTHPEICRELAVRLSTVGWVAGVNHVRRRCDGRLEVSCRYRRPMAMIRQGDDFLLVDATGIRLPGRYIYDRTWPLLLGVSAPAPACGHPWDGRDVQAGLALLDVMQNESFASQITGINVENFAGRINPRLTHLALTTDQRDGLIRWGSAPGFELEENSVEQKLAILRENFRVTGRADATYRIIDVSTFPDRFTVPDLGVLGRADNNLPPSMACGTEILRADSRINDRMGRS